jgi:hypothetical protein
MSIDWEDPAARSDLDDELGALLAGELSKADGEGIFALSRFLEALRLVEGVIFNTTVVEVPISALVEAQEAGALHNLELGVDAFDRPYLMGLVVSESGDERIVLASRSFVEVGPGDDADEDDEWEADD